MSDRVFRKDKNVVDSLNNLGFTAHWDTELVIRIVGYSDLTTLQQTTVDTTLSAANYLFAYDD